MTGTVKVGQEIRGLHPYVFRSGQWGVIRDIVIVKDRRCYMVQFPDTMVDFWPVEDPTAEYEFRAPARV